MSLNRGLLSASAAMILAAMPVRAEGVFTLTSSSFSDGGALAVKNAGNYPQNPNCVGDNVSPPLSWVNPPPGTRSYALLMFDPEGRPPAGVTHWVAYGIPETVRGFAEGEVSKAATSFISGKNTVNLPFYLGPCPGPGSPHHYTFTLFATDLEPGALPAGLTRGEVLKALEGHVLDVTGIVGVFGR